MLTHDHIAAGAIVAALGFFLGWLDEWLVLLMLLGGLAPDLDYFWPSRETHRNLPSHAPVFYVLLSFLVFFPVIEWIGWFSIGCVVHLIVDTVDWGIMWGWPLTKQRYFVGIRSWKEFLKAPYLSWLRIILLLGMILGLLALPLGFLSLVPVYIIFWMSMTSLIKKKIEET